jgi:uncharacterized membrane protein
MNMQTFFSTDLFLQIITTGRLTSIIAAVVGLISVVIGRLALSRSAHRAGSGQFMSIVAIMIALICTILAIYHLASTTGGFGTGKGRAGAIVALVIGLIGIILGVKALFRSRTATNSC